MITSTPGPQAVMVTLLTSLLSALPAYGVGVAGAVGVVVYDNSLEKEVEDTPDADLSSGSMVGPLVSVALRGGDWVDHQLVVQWHTARGPFNIRQTAEPHEEPGGSIGVYAIGGGYQLGLDIGGKEGFHRLSPCLAVGFIVGGGRIRMRASSDDPDVQSALEEDGFDDKREPVDPFYLALHALAGVRVRLSDDVGVRAVVARSTTGGLSAWQPQIVVDFTPGREG